MTKSEQTNSKVAVMKAAMEDKKALDVVVVELKGKTLMADYFVICTATSRPQINAVVDAVREQFRDAGLRKPAVEGQDQSKWVLLDAGDVVGHVFAPDERAFYNLEAFWTNAKPLAS
jgi:ribosome-associated protein